MVKKTRRSWRQENAGPQAIHPGLMDIVDEVEQPLSQSLGDKFQLILASEETMSESNTFKVAIPLAEGRLCNHFGHCQQFAVIRVKEGVIDGEELHTPPPHEPGVLPRWLGDLGVNLIFAGGMGQRALSLFAERGIRVITGAPSLDPEALTKSYLAGNLMSGANVCDH
jgi:ATP-binding protein involved in chromosome partitioning